MVYKRDVCEWFHKLDAPSRIEVVCELLKMCLPLELRLFGSCLEDLARKDFLPLKELELRANAFKGLGSVEELAEPGTRSLLITYVCLLHPSNKQCSAILFNVLSSLVPKLELLRSISSVDEYIEDVLLLMTIAVHHPAFCFDQKQQLIEHLKTIKALCISKQQNGLETVRCGSSPAATMESIGKQDTPFVPRLGCSIKMDSALRPDGSAKRDIRMVGNYSHPTSISLLGIGSRAPAHFTLEVTWNTQQKSVVNKTMDDLSNFHLQLVEWSSAANIGGTSFEKSMTRMKSSLQGAVNFIRCGTLSDKFVKRLSSYFEELFKSHEAIPKCDVTRQFFAASSTPKGSPASEEGESLSFNVSDLRSNGGLSPSVEHTRVASKKAAQISIAPATHELQGLQTSTDFRLTFGSDSPSETASGLRLLVGSGDAKSQQWCDQLTHLLEDVGLQKHVKKLPNVSRETFFRMSENDIMQKFGLSEHHAKKLVSGREKLLLSNGFVRPTSGSASRTGNPADDRSQRSDVHSLGVSRVHSKDEESASMRATVGVAGKAIPSDELHPTSELEQSVSRRACLQSAKIMATTSRDQTCSAADDATKREVQEIRAVSRPSLAPGMPVKERKLPRSQTSSFPDGGSYTRRFGSRSASGTTFDCSHGVGQSHQHRPGTVVQAAAAAAASCASGIQPLAGGKLREPQGNMSKKASPDESSGVSLSPAPIFTDSQDHPPVDGRLLGTVDEPAFARPSGSASLLPQDSCSSPEGSSVSDGGEPDATSILQPSLHLFPTAYPLYTTSPHGPEFFSNFNVPLPLAIAPSASQVSPSSQGPVPFARSMGASTYGHRPHMPPSHSGRYATMPTSFTHGVHSMPPGSMVMSQNGVPSAGGAVPGDLFFQSRPGSFFNISSQAMPPHTASYPIPLLSPHASRGSHPGPMPVMFAYAHGNKNGCYNCGQAGHKASDCREQFPDNFSNQYRLNYESQPDTDG